MKKKIPRIAATLKYGPPLPLVLFIVMQILFYVCVAGFVGGLVELFLYLFGITKDIEDAWIPMVVTVAVSVFPLIFLIPRAIVKHKIRLWLKDAVLLTAQCRTAAAREVTSRWGFSCHYIKISLKFFYNGEKYIRVSGNPQRHHDLNGYSLRYWDYTDRDIQILYSPSYDQVMILKKDKLNSK